MAGVLGEFPEVRFAYVFGSLARGHARPDSDCDVAVYLEATLSSRERFDIRRRIAAATAPGDRVDVTILNDAPPLLAHRALSGRLILQRDRVAHARFFVESLAMAGDQAHWDRIHAEARGKRLAEGRFGRP